MTDLAGYSCLSFLTDYGRSDGFVAICHGQMLRHAPAVRIIDITHEVPPGDVRRGATVLAETVPELPPAVHVCVVDPGVGTERRSVAIAAGGHVLVGPDNGLMTWAAAALGGVGGVRELTEPRLWRHPVSRTFHGRDVYAPVGARIAAGLPLEEVGEEVAADTLRSLPEPRSAVGPGAAHGEVRAIDRFGNVQLSLGGGALERMGGAPEGPRRVAVRLRDRGDRVIAVGATFGDVAPGELVLIADSAGHLAVAENGGNAAERLGTAVGDPVDLEIREG
ncbi:hypothetical protein HDA32_000280 [Spinactinospora alkalitolerans]|uniref:SAM-dependent chlorinase/fluorinase n=1 Tax=Spinactinospora alkalitolerans TaxID=687207 RepID=A0A852TT85_9ACTN|nr:SAM-dependent chlorinase/fluorinase [Spinactinospora alkalitolerans]NYE45160.1 hypothetical protein [Spinactinospora alkalitolerans]